MNSKVGIRKQRHRLHSSLRSFLDYLPMPGRTDVHFLHIGKTGGSQIKRILTSMNRTQSRYRFHMHNHSVMLRQVPPDHAYFLSIRDPVSRFVSGFYSRKRKGMPRIFVDWSAHEARAFSAFEEANDLAEALFDPGPRGLEAAAAITSIHHTARHETDYMNFYGYFAELRPPLAIIRQKHLEADLERLFAKLGLPKTWSLSSDPKKMHANDYSKSPPLSPRAVENLERWYARDVEFCRLCDAWIAAQSD